MKFLNILTWGLILFYPYITHAGINEIDGDIARSDNMVDMIAKAKEVRFLNWSKNDINIDVIWRSYLYGYKENDDNLLNPNNALFNVPQPWTKNQLEISFAVPILDDVTLNFWDVATLFDAPLEKNNLILENYLSYKQKNSNWQIGKIRVNWATSLGRNPFDLFRRFPQVPFDPDNAPQLQEGINMALFEYKNNHKSYTFLLGDCPNNVCNIKGKQLASRITFQTDQVEWIWILNKKLGRDFSFGIGFNALLQDNLVFRMENLINNFRDRNIPIRTEIENATGKEYKIPAIYYFLKSTQKIFNELLIGIDLTFKDSQLLQLEYYVNTNGYTKNENNLLKSGIKSASMNKAYISQENFFPTENPYRGFLYQTANYSFNSVLRRNYINARYSTNQKYSLWQFNAYSIVGMDDHSQIYYIDFKYFVNDFTTIIPSLTFFNGRKLSQYRLVPDKYIANVLIRFNF